MERFSYRNLYRLLTPLYGDREAKSVARFALEAKYGITMEDIVMGKDLLTAEDADELTTRLLSGEPVQYVVGRAEFGGRWFSVDPSVLIPRPETAQMVELIVEEARERRKPCHILDIGTGSGCIAVTLALEVEQSEVEAIDISADAIKVARKNAENLKTEVGFRCIDILCAQPKSNTFDIIVSNPPYICENERKEMEPNVVDHEPSIALFVNDNDPLLFYRAISKYAAVALKTEGTLWFETNRKYAEEVKKCAEDEGFTDVETIPDMFGNQRFVKARKR